ncbi:MAG: hypothetical protein GU356_02010 [Pyrobaculum sp.]|jgi:hypothetical protein|nr:hypothetical protein [Pyrobaculum sp.]
MELNEIKQRLELALRPVEKPPTLEEVLAQVSTRGVLRGPVDWVFPAWMLYVEYTTQKIAETFQLSEEEKRQLLHFRDAMKQLLLEAQRQAKAKLTALYKAVAEGTYKAEGKRLYAPDGTWMEKTSLVPRIPIHGIGVSVRFPDVLKLPCERLELFQLGWRASDEFTNSRKSNSDYAAMKTTQPWQVFAWVAVRFGELYAYVASVNLAREGASIVVRAVAVSWRQKWSKDETISLVAENFRRGEWASMLTMWLGDGKARWRGILRGRYALSIAAKEPWRLGLGVSTYEAIVATGREAFERLRKAAGVYGELLDLLKAHKWIYIKLATDDTLRVDHKLKVENGKIHTKPHTERPSRTSTKPRSRADKPGAVAVAGLIMHLRLVSGRGGSLLAEHYTRDPEKAHAAADKLKAAGLRPNIVRSGPNYVVYIATTDLLKLAEEDDAVRRAVALYLTEKAKNGTPRQREIAEKILQRHPFLNPGLPLLQNQ